MMISPGTSNDSELFTRPAPQAPWYLFLDIDSTLSDIAPIPDAVNVGAPHVVGIKLVEHDKSTAIGPGDALGWPEGILAA